MQTVINHVTQNLLNITFPKARESFQGLSQLATEQLHWKRTYNYYLGIGRIIKTNCFGNKHLLITFIGNNDS